MDWINEKNEAIADDSEYGNDLPSVKRLQRKHDGFERDLDALGDRIRELDDVSQRLMNTHPDQAEAIYQKQIKIQNAWTELTQKADARKAKLLDSFDYQSYMANSRDLNSWINSMVSQVSSEELAPPRSALKRKDDPNAGGTPEPTRPGEKEPSAWAKFNR